MTRLSLVLSLGVLLTGCVGGGMRIPGPTRHIGEVPLIERLPVSEGAVHEAVAELAPVVEEARPVPKPSRKQQRGAEEIAETAAHLVGQRTLKVGAEKFRSDCSGFVAAAYAGGGIDIGGSSADLYERAKAAGVLHRRRTPSVGDLAFFDQTYDRNRNGRRDDPLSHVAVVESIADDGTIVMVHYGSKGVARITMDLREPDVHVDDDGVLRNSIIRGDRKGKTLSGELFRAFGSLWQVDEDRG